VLAGSFFARNKLRCHEVLYLGYMWLTKASYTTALIQTGHSSPTVTEYYSHYRQLVITDIDTEDTVIGGQNIVVEIDESKFGRRKNNRGHHVEGIWVLGGIEKTEERRTFLVPIQSRDANTLLTLISAHVHPGSIIYTDCWRGYAGLEDGLPYTHFTVNHSQTFVDADSGVHTNTIEGTWAGVKMRIAPRNRNSNIQNHLFEFIWRRKYESSLWQRLLHALKETLYE
jgi:transposase-like protein